ncbi:restriction endonuclease subunit S [Streptomyces sp. cmx-10-25]|uniref:restriction endonuclease subunit S n=1 Tax=Streptomyces sp. cmx-10-25 TaxID=2790919 RepID=UPI003980237F
MPTDAEIRWVPVREAGEVRMGKQLSPSSREAAGQHPYLRVANVYEGRIDLSDVKTMGFSSAEREVYSLHPGDILLNEGQENLRMVGRSAIYTGEPGAFCFQNTLIRFRPGSEVLPEYAQAVFVRWRAQGVFASIAEKTSISHLGGNRFGSLLFPLRSLVEQQRIIERIEAVSTQERAIVRSIAKLKRLGEGVAAAQLAGVELGRFEDVIEYGPQNGIYKAASSYGVEGTPIVRIDSFRGGPSDFTRNLLRVSLTAAEAASYGLAVGDILVNRVNTPELVGKSTAVRELAEPTVFESNMMRCKVRADRAVPTFVEMWLGSVLPKKHFRVHAKSAISQASINGDDVRDCPFPRIEVSEQHAILEGLTAVTAQLCLEEAELAKLRGLKQELVDDLLSGRA